MHSKTEVGGWLDVAGAARHLSLSEDAVRALVKRRELPFVKFPNGRIRFDRDTLDAWARSEAA